MRLPRSVMKNFGYPSQPTDRFPKAITEGMARDFFAFLCGICSQHFVTAALMVPVLWIGWDESSDAVKSLFILGTLSDVGFDVYDAIQTSLRTFTNFGGPEAAIPIDTWVVVVAMHHTMAMSLCIPMNLSYPHRYEYHQTAVSLLMAASICYAAGCWKFTLNFEKRRDFILYKAVVILQLVTILYTRFYLWFPTMLSFRAHLVEQKETTFLYGATFMLVIFTLFNLILVADAVKAAVKYLPKPFPKTKKERQESELMMRRASGIDAPGLGQAAELTKALFHRRKLKGAVHSVIAARRMTSSMSAKSGGKSD